MFCDLRLETLNGFVRCSSCCDKLIPSCPYEGSEITYNKIQELLETKYE